MPLLLGAKTEARPIESVECIKTPKFWLRSIERSTQRYCHLIKSARLNSHANPKRADYFLTQAEALKPTGDLGYFERARLLYLNSETESAHALLSEVFGPRLAEYPQYFLLSAQIMSTFGDRERSIDFYTKALLANRLPATGRPRAQFYLETALLLSKNGRDEKGRCLSLFSKAQAEDAPLLAPLLASAELLIRSRIQWSNRAPIQEVSPSNTGRLNKQSSEQKDGEDEQSLVGHYEKLVWLFQRLPKGRGRFGDILPVLPPAEHLALFRAAAQLDRRSDLALLVHHQFVEALRREEKPPYSRALLEFPLEGKVQ